MNTKNLLIIGAVVVIGALALWGLAGNKSSYQTQEASLQSDLYSLDSTDLDSVDGQLDQLSTDSSTF